MQICSVNGPVMLSLSSPAPLVRKPSFGGRGRGGYHPNTHHAYTVHSGTNVEQVRFMLCVLVCRLPFKKEMLLECLCIQPLMQAVLEEIAYMFVAVRLLSACDLLLLLPGFACSWQHIFYLKPCGAGPCILAPICLLDVTPGHPELRVFPALLITTQFNHLCEQQLSCYCSLWCLSDSLVPCMEAAPNRMCIKLKGV